MGDAVGPGAEEMLSFGEEGPGPLVLAAGVAPAHPWLIGEDAHFDAADIGDNAPRRKRGRPRKQIEPRRAQPDGRSVLAKRVRQNMSPVSSTWIHNVPQSSDPIYVGMTKALLASDSLGRLPGRADDCWDLVAEHALGVAKARSILPTQAEARLLGYEASSASFVRESVDFRGCAVFTVARLAWGAVLSKIIEMHDSGKLKILIDFSMLSADKTSLTAGLTE